MVSVKLSDEVHLELTFASVDLVSFLSRVRPTCAVCVCDVDACETLHELLRLTKKEEKKNIKGCVFDK